MQSLLCRISRKEWTSHSISTLLPSARETCEFTREIINEVFRKEISTDARNKMKEKIRKLIDENFGQTDVFNDNEDDFTIATSVNDILADDIEQFPTTFAFKSQVFPADVLPESAKRKGIAVNDGKDFFDSPSEHGSSDDDQDSVSGEENDSVSEEESDAGDGSSASFDEEDDEPPEETSSKKKVRFTEPMDEEESSDGSADSDDSDIEDDIGSADDSQGDVDMSGVFSKQILDNSVELRKATAVTSQLNLFDNLMENRILLQKCISDVNTLPSLDETRSSSRQNSIEHLEKYLIKLIELQKKLRSETTDGAKVEEEDYDTFRSKSIEHWYNKTRGARSNFSAFELPLLEQIRNDRTDLIEKTYLKRSEPPKSDETTTTECEVQIDPETVNDDDFYHKLLRHYIKRKTANISDSTQLGRHWIKLQSLRSKMKRKIDTRRTKGRKIKFDPHNKLVNFMAMQDLRKWPEESINELYSSVFGKGIVNA